MKKDISKCRFCGLVCGHYRYLGVDEPFKNNDDYIAVATIGAIVEGWTLVLPKRHRLSMKSVYAETNFRAFINALIYPLAKQYGPLIAFEHGCNQEGSPTGCGTDHAHLHLVPSTESLLPSMYRNLPKWNRCRPSEVEAKSHSKEYLFYVELDKDKWNDPEGYIHLLNHPISQFFRRIIASQKGDIETADYKQFPYLDTAKRTRDTMANVLA